MSMWPIKRLGGVCEIIMGQSPPGSTYNATGNGIPLINGPVEFSKGSDGRTVRSKFTTQPTKYCKEGDLILCVRGSTTGRMNIAGFDACIGRGVAALRARAYQPWINYFIRSKREAIYARGTGSTFPNVSSADLASMEVAFPTVSEQQRIVGILDEAFEGIAAAKANAEKNLQNARAIFESHLNLLLKGDSRGWVQTTIGEACVLRSGTTLSPQIERASGEVPYLKVADMNLVGNAAGIHCSTRYVNRTDVNASNLLAVGTTIFPKRGGAILTNKKRITKRVICADLNIMGVTPRDQLLPEFLFNIFQTINLRDINNGSSIPQINNYSIEPLRISFPRSTAEQQRIVDEIEMLRSATQRLESLYRQKLAALDALKKSLLPRGIRGRVVDRSMAFTTSQVDLWRTEPSEHQNLEFKEAKTQFDNTRLYKYCVALANEGGGHVLLGVQDKPPRKVVGSAAFNDPVEMAAKVFHVLGFRVEIDVVDHPDGRVVVFSIPSRPRGTAFTYEGAYWMRAGEELVAMSEDRLRGIFAEGRPDWLMQDALTSCTDAQVIELLDTQAYFDLIHLPYPPTRAGVLQRFEKESLIRPEAGGWTITNLVALLFAKKLENFGLLARKAPRVIRYEGTSKLKTISDRPGTKGYAVAFQALVEHVNGLVPSNEVIEQALRREVKMFPEIAIRELIANALIHQDLDETGASVMIELYADRLEVSNPGKPFISPDRFIDEYQSRNERLADLARRLGICEEKGSGIDKVVHAAEVFQLPAPDFRVSERRTSAVLFAHLDIEEMDRNDRIRAAYQHCCLRYVMNEQMTNQSLRDRFKLPESKAATVSQIIAATIEGGKIKVADPNQTSTRYRSYVPFWA